MRLTEAVEQKHLVQWLDNGFLRTLEPHALVRIRGERDVLFAYQIAGGPKLEEQAGWKVVDASDALTVDHDTRFVRCRRIPQHLQALVCSTYASVGPMPTVATLPRR